MYTIQFTGALNESTVGVGGDSAGGRLAAVVCHDLQGIDYQVTLRGGVIIVIGGVRYRSLLIRLWEGLEQR